MKDRMEDKAKATMTEMSAELEALRAENERLKKALAENEARLNSLVHGIPDLVWLKDESGIYLSCNHAFEQFFGAPEADIVGKTDYDFVNEHLADFFRANDLAAMLADKPLANEEWITFASDGRRVLLETIKTPLRNDCGELIGILGIGRDITERKQNQDQIELQRQILLTQQEVSPDGIFVEDGAYEILSYNQQFIDIWQFPEELIQDADSEVFLNYSASQVVDSEKYLSRVRWLDANPEAQGHDEIRLKDGRFLDQTTRPFSADGKHLGRIWYFRDITERKRMEEALHRSRDFLENIVNSMPSPVFVKNRQHRWVLLNDALCKFIGHRREELLGKSDFDFFPEHEARVFWEGDEKVFASGQVFVNEEEITDAGGNVRHIITSKTPLDLGYGEQVLVGIISDITDRKLAEDALRVSEERYRAAFHGSLDAISITHLSDGLFMEVNQPFSDVFGFSYKEIIGRRSIDLHIWANLEDRQRLVEAVRKDGKCVDFEAQFKKKNGELIWGAMSAVAIELGGAPCLFIYTRDITERKRDEEALRASEAMKAAILEGAHEGICAFDRDLNYILFNPFLEKVSGIPESHILGRHFLEFAPFVDKQEMHERIKSVLETGETNKRRQFRYDIESTGQKGWMSAVSSPLLDAEGNTTGVISLLSDITEQVNAQVALEELTQSLEKQVEERTKQLVKAREEAEATAGMTQEFLAEMSHEIRTPLNAIIGMTYLAQNENAAPKMEGYLDQVHASGQHLLEVVNEVLDISKIQAGKQAISASGFSVKTMLDYVVGTIRKAAVDKGLALAVEIDPTMPDRLLGDAFRISQILINFMNNAVKYTDHGSVTLRVSPLEFVEGAVRLRFEVEDTGEGLSEEELPLLFMPYQQLNDSEEIAKEGTGLGLVISRKLATLMGGRVGVESLPQQGSIFTFEIMLDQESEVLPASGTAQRAEVAKPIFSDSDVERRRTNLAGCHVLLAEDNPVNQYVILELMELVGVKVTIANNGEEALHLLSEQLFDMVLMDIRMPKLDGLEATRALRQNAAYADLPVVALTANASGASRDACLAAGMNDYIQKPVDPAVLFAILERYYKSAKSPKVEGKGTPVSESDLHLFELLSNIPELDVAVGVNRMMRRNDLYASLARKITEKYADMPEMLEAAMQKGDVEELTHCVHGMKSNFGALGATELQKQCAEVEQMLTSDALASDSMGELIADLRALLIQLQVAIESVEQH